jgi:CheY-like chemotaxis protein
MTDKGKPFVLMIEDDPNDAALFRRALRKSNLPTPVTVIDDGEAAVRWLREKAEASPAGDPEWPRIIVLDLKMPRRSGLEVLEWLRTQPGGRRVPVVVFTSSRESRDIARAYALGVNSYLVKPVSFDAWKEMIRTMHHYWMDLNERPEPAGGG